MDTYELLLAEMRDQAGRLTNIEEAVVSIARQDEKITTMQKEIKILFQKNELAFNPKDGVVTNIKVFQEGCPRTDMEKSLTRQWAAIALLATITAGSILKLLGAF